MSKAPLKSPRSKASNESEAVTEFMENLEHPLKAEVEAVRKIIKGASQKISERIKWSAPSYYYKEDLVTFNLRNQKKVHLVFHHVAVVDIKSDLLEGDYRDRRMMYFNNMKEITTHKKELNRIIGELVNAME
jgi:hypothetical protein